MPKTKAEKQKEKVIAFYQKAEYEKAFETLFELEITDALKYFENKKWYENEFFWNSFITNEEWFSKLLNGLNGERFIYLYFAKSKIQSSYFEFNVASTFPDEFILAVRRTKAFLDPNRIHHLTKLILPENYKAHQKAWAEFYQEFIGIGSLIQRNYDKLNKSKIETDLAGCVVWLEEKRFKSDDIETFALAVTYSRFIEHYFSGFLVANYEFNTEAYQTSFLKILYGKATNPMSGYLDSMHRFTDFNSRFLEAYSFDDNCIPIVKNGHLELKYKKQAKYEDWKKDEGRYHAVKHIYEMRAANEAIEMEDAGVLKIPKGKLPEDEELNRTLYMQETAIKVMLKELQLSQFKVGSRDIFYKPLLELFNCYVGNLKDRYERHLSIASENVNTYREAYDSVFKRGQELDILMLPDFLLEIDEFVAHSRQAMTGISKAECEDLVRLFSYEPNPNKKFDFLAPKYDVWFTPFVKFKSHIFCPTFLLARNALFFSFAQVLLKNNHQTKLNKSAKDMEITLADFFKGQGWQAERIDEDDIRNERGDVDVMIESEKSILLIQLKRTFFRTDLENAYNENETSTKKAARQLIDAAHFYENKNPTKTIYKWIVSTSFENLYQKHNNTLKLNYFEIIQSFYVESFDSFEEWIDYMESDTFFKETSVKYQEFLKNISNNEPN